MSETGHAKNVANMETLISDIQSFGAGYNPPRGNMKNPALATMNASARDAVQEVNNFQNASSVAKKQRADAFKDLDKLVTRVLGALESATRQTMPSNAHAPWRAR